MEDLIKLLKNNNVAFLEKEGFIIVDDFNVTINFNTKNPIMIKNEFNLKTDQISSMSFDENLLDNIDITTYESIFDMDSFKIEYDLK